MTTAASAPTDLKSTLEEMRASVAAQGARKGLAALVQDAVLKLLEVLMALLEDLRAGRLAVVAPAAEDAADGPHPINPPQGARVISGEAAGLRVDSGWRGWWPGSWFPRHDRTADRVPEDRGQEDWGQEDWGREDWGQADWRQEDWVPAFAGMTASAVTFAEMTARAVTLGGMAAEGVSFAGTTRRIEDCPTQSEGFAQSGCDSLWGNDETTGIGGDEALPPLEGSSVRQSGDDGVNAGGTAGMPAGLAEEWANGTDGCGCLPPTLTLPLKGGGSPGRTPRLSAPSAVQNDGATNYEGFARTMAGYARHLPRSPALRCVDAKNRGLCGGKSREVIVPL